MTNPQSRSKEAEIWRRPAEVTFLWQYWEDEAVVYNCASGETHLLDALAAAVLKEVETRPQSSADLAAHLAGQFGLDLDSLSRRLLTIGESFDELGLIEIERA